MKVLGICASPRRGGNNETLLDKALKGASSKGAFIEKVFINELDIKPCQAHAENRCYKNGRCYIKDDMQPLYKKLKRYDAIIVVSPVYFGSIPAQLKAVVDRCQAVWVENFILKKRKTASKRKGMLILTSGCNNKNFFRNSEEIIRIFFAVLGVKLFKKLYVPNLEKRRDILKRTDALNKAFEYGISLTG